MRHAGRSPLKPANVGQLRCFGGVAPAAARGSGPAHASRRQPTLAGGFWLCQQQYPGATYQLREKLNAAKAEDRPRPEDYARLYQLALGRVLSLIILFIVHFFF